MKQLTCEMCGSTDLLKQEGVFVCQICGCKYSVEEAKKMMVEGTVQIEGDVKVKDADFVIKAGVLEKYNGESTKVIIPNNVKTIGEKCFDHLPIEEVIIPDSVIEIRTEAFKFCNALKSIIIPNSVKKIYSKAFYFCGLISVKIPKGIEMYPSVFDCCSHLDPTKVECDSYSDPKGTPTFGVTLGFPSKGYCANCASQITLKSFGRYVCQRCGHKRTLTKD